MQPVVSQLPRNAFEASIYLMETNLLFLWLLQFHGINNGFSTYNTTGQDQFEWKKSLDGTLEHSNSIKWNDGEAVFILLLFRHYSFIYYSLKPLAFEYILKKVRRSERRLRWFPILVLTAHAIWTCESKPYLATGTPYEHLYANYKTTNYIIRKY